MKKRWKIAGLALLVLGLLFLHQHHHISVEEILSWQPENLFLAAIAIECFFAIKSASVFIPIMIPQILAGHLYPRDIALLINLLGLVIVMSVPYWIGKMAFCFMLRACSVPPADIVTMYLGATGMPFITSVIGGVLGYFPGMVLTTFLGASRSMVSQRLSRLLTIPMKSMATGKIPVLCWREMPHGALR